MSADSQKSRVTVLLDRSEWERLDAYCQATGHKKSTLLARLIRDHLDREDFRTQGDIFERGVRG